MPKLLDRLMKKTRVVGVRVPATIHLLYETLDRDDIAELKLLVSAFVVSKAVEKGLEIPEEIKAEFKNLVTKTTQNNNVIFNINISKAESKSEAKAEIDITKLIQTLNEFQKLLLEIQKSNFSSRQNAYILPPARMKDIEKFMEDLRRLVN